MIQHDDPRFARFRKGRESNLVNAFFALSLPVEVFALLAASGFLDGAALPANDYCRVVLHAGIPLVAAAWFWAGSIRVGVSRSAGNSMALALFVLVLHEGWRLHAERHPGRDPIEIAFEGALGE